MSKKITLCISQELYKSITIEAERRGIPKTNMINIILLTHLEEYYSFSKNLLL